MPLESRATRAPAPVAARATRPATAPQAGADLNTSPRRRGLAPTTPPVEDPPADVGADPGVEVGATQHGGDVYQDNAAAMLGNEDGSVDPSDGEDVNPPEDRATTRPAALGAGYGEATAAKIRKPRTAKPKPALPANLEAANDPAALRELLRDVEGRAKALRAEFDAQSKALATEYRAINDKLADLLF